MKNNSYFKSFSYKVILDKKLQDEQRKTSWIWPDGWKKDIKNLNKQVRNNNEER